MLTVSWSHKILLWAWPVHSGCCPDCKASEETPLPKLCPAPNVLYLEKRNTHNGHSASAHNNKHQWDDFKQTEKWKHWHAVRREWEEPVALDMSYPLKLTFLWTGNWNVGEHNNPMSSHCQVAVVTAFLCQFNQVSKPRGNRRATWGGREDCFPECCKSVVSNSIFQYNQPNNRICTWSLMGIKW